MSDSLVDLATRLLQRQSPHSDDAEILQLLYGQLREMASRLISGERADHTLQATALVHEAWIRLIDSSQLEGEDPEAARRRFLALGARTMRRVLVDHARKRNADKRGGGARRITLTDGLVSGRSELDCLALEEAFEAVEAVNDRIARVAEMRVFAGMSGEEIAAVEKRSRASVEDDWALARALLSKQLRGE